MRERQRETQRWKGDRGREADRGPRDAVRQRDRDGETKRQRRRDKETAANSKCDVNQRSINELT